MGRESYLVDLLGGEIGENARFSSTGLEEVSPYVTGVTDGSGIEGVTL